MFNRLKISARSSIALAARDRHAAHRARDPRRDTTARAPGSATPIPMRELRRDGERRGVEPLRGRALVGRQRRIADEVRPLHAEAGERVEVGRLRDRDRHARLQRDERRRPSSRWRARRARRAAVVRAPGADRQVPHHRRHEDVRDVAGRVVALERAVEAVGDRIVRDRARSESTRRTPTRRRPPASSACRRPSTTGRATAAGAGSARARRSASCRRCCDTG